MSPRPLFGLTATVALGPRGIFVVGGGGGGDGGMNWGRELGQLQPRGLLSQERGYMFSEGQWG
jgi:hypothetical protein